MACKDTFRGYGPERGYDFLREAIIKNDFLEHYENIFHEEDFNLGKSFKASLKGTEKKVYLKVLF